MHFSEKQQSLYMGWSVRSQEKPGFLEFAQQKTPAQPKWITSFSKNNTIILLEKKGPVTFQFRSKNTWKKNDNVQEVWKRFIFYLETITAIDVCRDAALDKQYHKCLPRTVSFIFPTTYMPLVIIFEESKWRLLSQHHGCKSRHKNAGSQT